MLVNSFYSVEKTESFENTCRIGVVLNSSHEIYKAHFPGNPITPGVCLLQIALELLNVKFERNLSKSCFANNNVNIGKNQIVFGFVLN